jgi:hypothetical protein
MDIATNLLNFLTPTHTHNFDNHSIDYSHSNTVLVRSLADCHKSDSSLGFEARRRFRNLARFMIFRIVVLLIGLGSLMICTHILIVFTKTKEMTRYCGLHTFGGKTALNTRF